MDIKEFFDKSNEKFNAFPMWKKALAVLLIVGILISFFLLATAKSIETYTYASGCKEVYINGHLNGSECVFDREQMKKDDFQFDVNLSNLYK